MKYYVIIVVFFVNILASYSQLSTKHWISPIHSRSSNQVEDHYVYLSTPEPTPFQVSITDGAGTLLGTPVTISQNNPVRVLIGTEQPSVMFLDVSELNTPQTNKGLILEGSSPFYVSFRVRSESQAGYLTSKGVLGLGESFRLGSFPQQINRNSRNFYASVMATEDGTNVTFSEYNSGIMFITDTGTISPNTVTVTLNAGETYTLSGYTDVVANLDGFVGALVTSNKPITVNTGNALGSLVASGGQDYGIDQIVPIEVVGQEYIAIEGGGDSNNEKLIVVATKDNTEVFINNASIPAVTINAGEYYIVENNFYQGTSHRNVRVFASEPVYVYQALAGNLGNTTPGMNFLPPLNCLLLTEVDLIADVDSIGNTIYSGDIIATSLRDAELSINGTPIATTPEDVLGNTDWVTHRISGFTGNVKITSTGPLSVGVFGFNNAAGFGGYYSGFGFDGQETIVKVCENNSNLVNILNEIPGNPLSGGVWTPPFASGTDFFNPLIDTPRVYNYFLVNECAPIDIDVDIQLTPAPIIGVVSSITLCDDSVRDQITVFDLTNAKTEALGGQSETDVVVSFFKTETDAETNSNEIVGLTYTNTLPTETLYARVTSAINFSCFEIEEFTITVSTPIANSGTDISITCSNQNITLDGSLSLGVGTINYQWATTTGNIVSGATTATPIVDMPGVYELTVSTTELGITCSDTDEVEVIDGFIQPIANNPINEVITKCDDEDGNTSNNSEVFNLLLNNEELRRGNPDESSISVVYFTNLSDAQSNINAIINPTTYRNTTNPETIFARLNSPNKTCFTIKPFDLTVNAIPVVTNVVLTECDVDTTTSSTDGIFEFNLEDAYNDITGSTPNLALIFYKNMTDLLADTNRIDPVKYRNATNNEVLLVNVVNSNNCSNIASLELEVESTSASNPQTKSTEYTCDVNGQDNFLNGNFDLNNIISRLYGTPPIPIIRFYLSIEDAVLKENELPLSSSFLSENGTLFVREEQGIEECPHFDKIELRINETAKIDLEEQYLLCNGDEIILEAPVDADTFVWYRLDDSLNQTVINTTSSVAISDPGVYGLRVGKTTMNPLGPIDCSNEKTFEIIISDIATITEINATTFLDKKNSLEAIITGNGEYEFSLAQVGSSSFLIDSQRFQESNIFEGLSPGNYELFVRNKQGCGVVSDFQTILGIPQFFSPNQDGINDTWQITVEDDLLLNTKIHVFNRYGKLLTELSTSGLGWNGFYNGKPMASDDYWYMITFQNGKTITGSFTLKR